MTSLLDPLIIEKVKNLNPWWEKRDWYKDDRDYSRALKSPFIHRWYGILKSAMRELVNNSNKFDMLILAGPRRVGKTCLMKRLIDDFLQQSTPIYLSLDDPLICRYVKEYGLETLINQVITNFKLKQPYLLILDEITALENEWSIQVKTLWDSYARKGKHFLLLVTGSLGLLLIRESVNLALRRGNIEKLSRIANPGIILPFKFSEYAEALKKVRFLIRTLQILGRSVRLEILNALAVKGETNRNLSRLFLLYQSLKRNRATIEKLIEIYLLTGGYPIVIYEYFIESRKRRKNMSISRGFYSEMINSLLADIKHTNIEEEQGRAFIEYLEEHGLDPHIDVGDLAKYLSTQYRISRRTQRRNDVWDVIRYFENIFTIVKAQHYCSTYKCPDPIQTKYKNEYSNTIKLFIVDPFILHAIMNRREHDPFIASKKLLSNDMNLGLIVEHVVCSHFLRLRSDLKLYYIIDENEKEIDCMYKLARDRWLAVEVKYTSNVRRLEEAANQSSLILSEIGLENTRPIIVNKDVFKITDDYCLIPFFIYLLLF